MSRWDAKELYDVLKSNGRPIPPELAEMVGADGADRPRQSKYRNVRTAYAGKVYDSKREAQRAAELDLLIKAGEIAGKLEQVPFALPGGVVYRADFVVLRNDGTWYAEDAKGVRTKEYKIKARLFAERYGQEIVEV